MNGSRLAVCLAASVLLAACGAGTTASSAPAAGTTAAPAASEAPPAAGPADGTALCEFLATQVQPMQDAGSTDGALATLTIALASWMDENPDRQITGAAELDALTVDTCAQTRTDILKTLGKDSFAASF